tara:strand:+ start:143 stop:448 length:306 start_codon:yes stop_codon:yes gene_type:complete
MRTILTTIALSTLLATSAFARSDGMAGGSMTCQDFLAMDSAGQMKAMGDMKSGDKMMKSDDKMKSGDKMMKSGDMTKTALAACEEYPDMTVGEAVKKSKNE